MDEVQRLRKQIVDAEADGSLPVGSDPWMVLQRRLENLEKQGARPACLPLPACLCLPASACLNLPLCLWACG